MVPPGRGRWAGQGGGGLELLLHGVQAGPQEGRRVGGPSSARRGDGERWGEGGVFCLGHRSAAAASGNL